MTRPPFIGVDGARISSKRSGWVAVAIDYSGFVAASFHERFQEVLATYPAPSIVAVDIPIGLVTSASRAADAAARERLGKRASSVFSSPVRPVLNAQSYEEAKEVSRLTCGKKISRQAWALVPRIREVDRYRDEVRVHEVHPEVSFAVLAGAPLAFPKKVWGGQAERFRLLERAGIVVPADLGDASSTGADDVLDAAVAAWSARRIANGEAISLPAERTELDGGREIAIWA